MAYVRDNIIHSTGLDDKVVFSQSLLTWNPKYAPIVGKVAKVTMDPLTFAIKMNNAEPFTIRFSGKADLTGISQIVVKADRYGSYAASMFVSDNGTDVIKSVAFDKTTPTEFTLDVSELTGEYYICFSAYAANIYEVALV